MRKYILLCLTFFCFVLAKADQLAYISKEQAMQAAEIIKKAKVVYSYCGCCEEAKPIKLKVDKIIVRATGYEDYYEVIVVYKGTEIALDMAYTWLKQDKKYNTVGKLAGMEHEPCRRIPK